MRHAFFLTLLWPPCPPPQWRSRASRRAAAGSSSPARASRIIATALAACLARNCPPNEDIDATAGARRGAVRRGRISRRAQHGPRVDRPQPRTRPRAYPEPVSDLYRANARVARHLGLDQDAQLSTRADPARASGRPARRGSPPFHRAARDRPVARSRSASTRRPRRELAELAERARAGRARRRRGERRAARLLWLDYLEAPQRQRAAAS